METGNYPVETIVPFGPPFEAKDDAKHWLKQNAQRDCAYALECFYPPEQPANLVAGTKKDTQMENPAKRI